jgi:hypothetical protein
MFDLLMMVESGWLELGALLKICIAVLCLVVGDDMPDSEIFEKVGKSDQLILRMLMWAL